MHAELIVACEHKTRPTNHVLEVIKALTGCNTANQLLASLARQVFPPTSMFEISTLSLTQAVQPLDLLVAMFLTAELVIGSNFASTVRGSRSITAAFIWRQPDPLLIGRALAFSWRSESAVRTCQNKWDLKTRNWAHS
jgi:hypothetical protein